MTLSSEKRIFLTLTSRFSNEVFSNEVLSYETTTENRNISKKGQMERV